MIRTRDADRVRTVTLDRPDRRNALTPEGLDALDDAVTDPPTPVVYLHGAGAAFCAGADLDAVGAVARESETDPSAAAEFARLGQRVARAIEESPAVVVAGIDGAARGGGVELALACDLRVATPEATFAEPGATFGLFGAWGGTHRLERVVGHGDALDLALSGRVVDAEEALRMGLVSRVRRDPHVVAREVADNDGPALDEIKRLMRPVESVADREERERAAFARLVEEHAAALGGGTGREGEGNPENER
ncbi:enoyl-CoA hydratase/isomerase family protein [Halomarina ordinaria]|uniref:Enoyl-CoA hydratase/isomerase family protein n=1 Tax=Halomarina ordinaria TaxID=3033939 RepID=A0ABD5UAG7_9EURY|nr:enoyl-CoA hydratase/isomerase family protein [Halomarina sp. PSRA2]